MVSPRIYVKIKTYVKCVSYDLEKKHFAEPNWIGNRQFDKVVIKKDTQIHVTTYVDTGVTCNPLVLSIALHGV